MPSFFVRSYPDRRTAWRAAVFLIEHGVLARTQDEQVATMPGIDRDQACFRHWVAVAFRTDLEHAAAMLDAFEPEPPPDESEWAHEAEPDLARLDPRLPVPCRACRHDLRPVRDARPVRCQRCGTVNDPVERVLAAHGPEALLDCYPDEPPDDPDWTEEAVLRRLQIPCPDCGCPLHALPVTGRCPACDSPYDKRAIVRHAFDAV